LPQSNPCRTAEPYGHLIGAVRCACIAHLVGVARVASADTNVIGVRAGVRYRGDQHPIAIGVDATRSRPAPGEIHRLSSLHPIPMRTERDLARRRCRRRRCSRSGCESRCRCRRRRWRGGRCQLGGVTPLAARQQQSGVAGERQLARSDDAFEAIGERREKVAPPSSPRRSRMGRWSWVRWWSRSGPRRRSRRCSWTRRRGGCWRRLRPHTD
jgi:hypothetical protein